MGTVGLLHRGKEYIFFFSVLALILLLGSISNSQKTIRRFIIVSVIIAIVSSAYIHLNSGAHNEHLYESERKGQEWILNYVSKDEVIFTDLRLSANLVANNHFKVIGPEDPDPQTLNVLKERLNKIFYGNNTQEAIQCLKTLHSTQGESFDYIFFSKRMTRDYPEPGIRIYGSSITPAPLNFLYKYDQSENLNKVYENGIATIYHHSS
jgi:hypothetical protein